VKQVIVQSLGELLDRTTPRTLDPASGRLRDSSIYRGVDNNDTRLLTSLDRLGGVERPHSKAHLEEHLLRNFIRYAQPFLKNHQNNFWAMVVTAEHHGLPTRLLDWTHSPLVAAHFATLPETAEVDRVIWQLNWKLVHERLKLKPVAFLVGDLDELLEQHGFKNPWDFLNSKIKKNFVCLLEPPAVTERLAVQSGAFTLSSAKDRPLDALLSEAGLEEALTRFIIPAQKVSFIRDQLDLATISERRLFPGLDGIAAELRRYYSAEPEPPNE
jgi:hypothetical protein